MNLFNRGFTLIVCLKLAAAAIAIIVLAWTMPQASIDALQDAVDWLQKHNHDLEKALLTSGGAFIALLALVVALLELLPRSGTEVKVTDLKVGDAVLSTAAISQRIDEAVAHVPHVAEGRSTVRAKRKGVLVLLDLHVDPEANLAVVSDEACQAAQDVLSDRVHVALLERPRVRLHYRELRLRGRPAPGPRPQAPVRPSVDPSVGHATGATAEASMAVAEAEAPGPAGVAATPEEHVSE
jgi:hypothetical protein